MICSLSKILKNPDADATGLPQQVEIFEWVRAHRQIPRHRLTDVLENPRICSALCERSAVPFTEAMLSWPTRPAPHGRRLGTLLV